MSDIFNNELFEAFASASDNVYIYVCDMKTDISRWSKAAVDYYKNMNKSSVVMPMFMDSKK